MEPRDGWGSGYWPSRPEVDEQEVMAEDEDEQIEEDGRIRFTPERRVRVGRGAKRVKTEPRYRETVLRFLAWAEQ